jgi:hypothetical protein
VSVFGVPAADYNAAVAATMREGALQEAVRVRCKTLGLLYYHTYRSTRSPAGFPDCVIVGPRTLLYRELKTAVGKVSAAQQSWLDALAAAGQDAAVWRPADLLSGRIDRELVGVAARR